ncbi:TonB-dependent receptor [Rudanella paleaurantiibacter]|uniref:TonB-dependent receptor n=1 Tax=Rudanella paleaurantiibacter TaxID=2614655 RepID=A0A7J5U4B9_9BACT|nr:outer membrane beta-barrel family protein [Rudanella paleaurantiibacter]KAB7732543.1 TonB-dependent receptor [Rudanella paleaurantiibacter]
MKSVTLSLLLLLLSACIVAFGQSPTKHTINGQVKTAAGQPLEFVTMLLVQASDSTKLVKGAISDANGGYAFENVTPGQYRIGAQQVGFAKTYSKPFAVDATQPTVAGPALTLAEESKNLSEVKVVAKKPFIEQQVDRTVVNVENSIVSSGNTALEVLEKAPGVTIDRQNDQIQLKGKAGVIVMIDGKQTYLSVQEVSNLLKNTPSDNIEKIEIITNPGSKYDASGNSGIINIKMKRDKNFGTNGTAILGAGMGRFEKTNASINLNHRQGKMTSFGSVNARYGRSFQTNDISRVIPLQGQTSYFDQNSYRVNFSRNVNFRAGFDYNLTRKSTVGAVLTGFSNLWAQPNGINTSYISNANREVTLVPTTNIRSDNRWNNITGNVNYKYDFDGKGRELTADADYSRFNADNLNDMTTRFYNAAGAEVQGAQRFRNPMMAEINIWAAKADYVHPTKKGKIEAGVKSSLVSTDNDMRFFDIIDNREVVNVRQTNRFQYNENINAAYTNFATKLNKKTNLQAGLRMEHTHSEGKSVTLNQIVTRDYVNLFPTVHVSRQLDTNHVLNVSYSRRIDRPSYQDLNPFKFYLDKYTYQEGNPYLRPQLTHSVEMTHVYKSAFSTTLGYSRTNDVIFREVPGQNPADSTTFVMTQNMRLQQNVTLTLSFPIPVRKWWNMQNNITALYNNIDAEYRGANLNVKAFTYNLYSANNFTLGKGFSAELAGWFNSAGVYGIMKTQPMGAFSLGVQKRVLDGKGTLRVNVNDPFWINKFRGSAQYQDINLRVGSRWESRQVRATFTYRFGNQNVKAARQRQSATSAEQNRVQSNN